MLHKRIGNNYLLMKEKKYIIYIYYIVIIIQGIFLPLFCKVFVKQSYDEHVNIY